MIKKKYITENNIKGALLNICQLMYMDNYRPDIIVGITRGGLYPATMLSHYLNTKMYTLDVRLRDGDIPENSKFLKEQIKKGKKILVVDDINDSGETFKWIANNWKLTKSNKKVKFAVIVDNIVSEFTSDYQGIEINKEENPEWIVFPYEEWWHDSK